MAERTVPCASCGKPVRSQKTPEPVCHACRKAARARTCPYCGDGFDAGRHLDKECCGQAHAQAYRAWRLDGYTDACLLRMIREVAPAMLGG